MSKRRLLNIQQAPNMNGDIYAYIEEGLTGSVSVWLFQTYLKGRGWRYLYSLPPLPPPSER